MTRVGIFSGTFDPVHGGHIEFALQASKDCKLDTVYFLPEKTPREKSGITSYSNRVAMLSLALKKYKNLQLGPEFDDKFTVAKTLPKLKQEFASSRLVFLLGSDVVETFKYRWGGLKEFLQTVELCIGMRGTDSPEAVTKILQEVNEQYGIKVIYTLVTITGAHIASTTIRQGKYLLDELDSDVAAYISDKKLYSDE